MDLKKENTNFELNEIKFHRIDNVKNYKYYDCFPMVKVETGHESKKDKDYYCVFDCPGKDAFAHWIFEIFISYSIAKKLKSLHPNLKIICTNTKKYVKNMFNYFNNDIKIIDKIENFSNVTFFLPLFSLNNIGADEELFTKFINGFDLSINIRLKDLTKIKILVLPRNKVDNYASNDRKIEGIEDISNNVIERGGTVLNTYEINNFDIQFNIINSSEIIILDWGSSFLVNCIFLRGKKIIVLDNHGLSYQKDAFKAMKILYDYICRKNNVILVGGKHKIIFSDIIQYLN